MIRPAAALGLLALAGAAAGLYQLKHKVAALEAEEARLARAVAAERQALRVLASEWAYLNRPERLAKIAARHLAVAPLDARAIIALEDLPPRRADIDEGNDNSDGDAAAGAAE